MPGAVNTHLKKVTGKSRNFERFSAVLELVLNHSDLGATQTIDSF
jgi:hypothetical protein